MFMGVKLHSVEEGKTNLGNVWTSEGSEKPRTEKSKSTSYTPCFRSIITDKVRRESTIAFGSRSDRDVNRGLLSRWKTDTQLLPEDAYDQDVKPEVDLTHALSRTQMELEDMQVMFEQAVRLGEQQKEEIRDLNEKLTEQIDLNSLLKSKVNFQEAANNILNASLNDEMKTLMDVQNALNEANKSTESVMLELNTEKAYTKTIQDDFIAAQNDYDSGLKSALEALKERLEDEKAKLVESLEETAAAKNKLRDTVDRLNRANSKLAVLERQLLEKESVYSEMVLTLSAEKGMLETANNTLRKEIKIFEDQLKEISEQLLYYQRSSTLLEPSNEDGTTLSDQISMIRDWSGVTDASIVSCQEFAKDRARQLSQMLVEETESPHIPKIIQSYLQITAMAVQLHFPDIKDVSTDMLIETVISSPFYLYYDLMMMFMRKIKHGLVEEEARLEAKRNSKSVPEQHNFLTRFFRLKHGKDITGKPKHRNVKSHVEIHSPKWRHEKHKKSKSMVKESKHHHSSEIQL